MKKRCAARTKWVTRQMSEDKAPAQHALWSAFLDELAAHESWDREFIPSPHDPGQAMRIFIDTAKAAAAPVLVDAIVRNEDSPLTYWACVGLEWLGAEAGPQAGAALEARAAFGKTNYWPAAVALEAVDPERARAANFERDPAAHQHLLQFHLDRGMESVFSFIDRIIDKGDAATIERTLRDMFLRAEARKNFPRHLADRVRALSKMHDSAGVRAAAANFLVEAKTQDATSELIRTLANSGGAGVGAVERFASHPDSELLVPSIVQDANLSKLADLLQRRRCAGLVTDPAPMRALLSEKLERPKREWRYEEHEVHYAALCVGDLQDTALIGSLLKAVVPENGGFAWEPLVRAVRALGAAAVEALKEEIAICPPGERRTRLEWALGSATKPIVSLRQKLENADDTFLRGRIEPSVWGAFRAYGNVVLEAPLAHAAFQLAWIDRAFGCEIMPTRVDWIRSLGFFDEDLLTHLATPVAEPLTGHRAAWDTGETQRHDPERAGLAEQAGLPSLAARWNRDERYGLAAKEQIARVRRAATPPRKTTRRRKAAPQYVAISDCEICSNLKEYERAVSNLLWFDQTEELPAAAARLVNRERCPICGTFYKHTVENDFGVGGSEDKETLTRLTFAQAKASLKAAEYESIMQWMPSNLTHSNAATRHFAAKCLVADCLVRGEAGAIRRYLEHADSDVVLGTLELLADVSGQLEYRPVLLQLLDRLQKLMAGSDERAEWAAAAIVRNLAIVPPG